MYVSLSLSVDDTASIYIPTYLQIMSFVLKAETNKHRQPLIFLAKVRCNGSFREMNDEARFIKYLLF